MATLGLIEKFRSWFGTKNIKTTTFSVEANLEGKVIRDFVEGFDYDTLKRRLKEVVLGLDRKYLDDIIGRATIENIALYILFNLKEVRISSVKVKEGRKQFVTVSLEDIPENYKFRLFFNRGASKLVRGKYELAIKDFNEAIKIKSDSTEAYNCRGRCYKFLDRHDLALNDYSTAIKINPNFGEAYRNKGNSKYYLGKFSTMMKDFNKAVALMPDSALAYNNRGFAYQYFRRHKQAIADHKKAIGLDPDYAEAYLDLARAYKAIGKIKLARENGLIGKRLKSLEDSTEIERRKIIFP
jgi:tetratricopeptide (TPR) repeat protein